MNAYDWNELLTIYEENEYPCVFKYVWICLIIFKKSTFIENKIISLKLVFLE